MRSWKLMAVTVTSLIVSAGLCQANLLTNPGFETGDFTGWAVGGWYNGTDDDAHTGDYGASREITSAIEGENYFVAEQWVPVTGALSYDLSGWMRIAGIPNASESFLELRWINASGGSEGQFGTAHLAETQDYTQYSLLAQLAPANAVTARVALVVHTTGGTITDTAWHTFDDLDFEQTIPEPTTMAFVGLGISMAAILRKRLTH